MRVHWLLAMTLTGCPGSDDKDTGPGTTGDDTAPDADDTGGGTDDTATTIAAPCADGGWGELDEALASGALWVAEGGTGDGTFGAPFGAIEDAITASRTTGARAIFVLPGSYVAQVVLSHGDGDDALALFGCGSGEVTVEGIDADTPVVKISEAQGVAVRGLTLEGGRRGLWIWQGATAMVEDVVASDNRRLGIVVSGSDTDVTLSRVSVVNPVRDSTDYGGFGITIQEASATLTDVSVTGTTEAGVVIDGSNSVVGMERVTVSGVEPRRSDGGGGRGMQIQSLASVSLTEVEVTDCADAGIFGLGALDLFLTTVTVSGVAAGVIPDSAEQSGDGVVITAGDPDADGAPGLLGGVDDVTVDGTARAGILLSGEGLAVEVAGSAITPSSSDPGGGLPLAQDGVMITSGTVYDLASSLAFDPTTIEVDPLTD